MNQRRPALIQACGVGTMGPISPRTRVPLRRDPADTPVDIALTVTSFCRPLTGTDRSSVSLREANS